MAVFKAKTATKDGRQWYFSVRYLNTNGEKKRKKSRKYLTESKALKAEKQFLINCTNEKKDITFKEMYKQYLDYVDEYIKGSTMYCKNSRMKNHILNYFGEIKINNITVNTIIAWKAKINKMTYDNGKRYSLTYKQTLYAELRTALNFGVNFCDLKDNVACKVIKFQDKRETVKSDEEKIRYITPDEYKLFTSVITDIVYKTFFAFLYYMGVRRGEAQALTWEDILWNTGQVRIIKTITNKTDKIDQNGNHFNITNTKNRKNRTIKMPIVLKTQLLQLYKYYMDFIGFNEKWFVFGGYRHIPGTTIDNKKDYYFKLVKEKYGNNSIKRITNHEFRHSHASYLISKGIKPERIACRLGDTIKVTMETYAHLFPETEEQIIDELDLIENDYKLKVNLLDSDIKKRIFKTSDSSKKSFI